MLTPRGGLGAALVGSTLFAVGGETTTQALGTVESFDVDAGKQWTSGPPMRTARHGVAVQSIGPQLYAIDGGRIAGNGQSSNVAEVFRQ
jgi:non-specific serine/threonine protein kinase